jgi:hypothetical protein
MKDKIDIENQRNELNTFLELYKELDKSLQEKIKSADNELSKVNYKIEKFFNEEEIYNTEQTIYATNVVVENEFKRKIKRYEIIIGLYLNKLEVMRKMLQENRISDSYELAHFKIDFFKVKIEIDAKRKFLNDLRKRKKLK